MLKQGLLILFFVFAALDLASQAFNLPFLHLIAKPMIVIILAAYYQQSNPVAIKGFLFALVFCWLGDVFLLFDHLNELFFMAGLGSFLVAHVLLIFCYRKFRLPGESQQSTLRIRLSFPVVLVGSGLVTVLYPKLGDLRIPVMVYAMALTLMVLQSIFRFGRTSAASFWLVFAGAVSFMISDTLLAINKFYQPVSQAGVLIMVTYIASLFLIVQGIIAHPKTAQF